MALGKFIRQGRQPENETILAIVHNSPDRMIVLTKLLEKCCANQQLHARGGFVSEGFVGKDAFSGLLEGADYPCYKEQVAQIEAAYKRKKFWHNLFTLGMGKNPPDEPVLPQHPLVTALHDLILMDLVECTANPDAPLRTELLYPSPALIKQLMMDNGQAAAS